MNDDNYIIDFDKGFISDKAFEECAKTGKTLKINGVEYWVTYNEELDTYKLFEKDGNTTGFIIVSKLDGIYLVFEYGLDLNRTSL